LEEPQPDLGPEGRAGSPLRGPGCSQRGGYASATESFWDASAPHSNPKLNSLQYCSEALICSCCYFIAVYTSDAQSEKENFLLLLKLIYMVLSQARAIVFRPTHEEFSFHYPASETVRIF